MRHRPLHAALSAFAEEAAWQLAADTAEGAEVPFEVVESGRRDTPLYCYRPLNDGFIRARTGVLGRLPSYPAAARALVGLDGLGDYLREREEPRVPVDPRERADAVLRVFVSRIFAEANEFVLTPGRLQRAYAELEDCLTEGRATAVVLCGVLGLELHSDEVALGDGLGLVSADALDDLPAHALWAPSGMADPQVLAALTLTDEPGAPPLAHVARTRLRRLLSALRLFDEAGVCLAPVAWLRSGTGPWEPVALGASGQPVDTCVVEPEAEDELRAFCSLVARRTPRSGELAWALRRYELGCERETPQEALTDHLLGLRALLEPEGPASGCLPQRLAALCALEDDRPALQARAAQAIALERAVVAGVAPEGEDVAELLGEISGHLRALLRDVLCGHLDADLRTVADRLSEQPTLG
jgi:hypothetical protein